ncbi:MAG: hypothetical protein ACHRXM_33470 [Isosphaerales bacterium]
MRRFIGGFLHIDSELLDHLLEPDPVLAGVIGVRSDRREPLVHPLPGGGIGDGSYVGGDLRGLSGDGRRTEHNRETAIERVIHPVIERQACKHTDGDGECRAERTAGGCHGGRAQLGGRGSQHSRTQLGRCAAGCHLLEPAFDVVVHFHSFTI